VRWWRDSTSPGLFGQFREYVTQVGYPLRVSNLQVGIGAAGARLGLAVSDQVTPSGERLLGKARRLLGLNDELWADMTELTVDGKAAAGQNKH